MPKPFNPHLFKKFKETLDKIGRRAHHRDEKNVVVYVALSEYLKIIEFDILEEPEYLEPPIGEKFKNPNLRFIEVLKDAILDIDKTLELSFWDKKNQHKRIGRR